MISEPPPPFSKLPPSPRAHFSLHVYEAVLMLLNYLESFGEERGRNWLELFPFLERYAEEARDHLGSENSNARQLLEEWRDALELWGADSETGAEIWPLRNLQDGGSPELNSIHVSTLVLAGLPEEDSRFGTVFARLQEPLGFRLPTIEFISQILDAPGGGGIDESGLRRGWEIVETLIAAGLLRIANQETARAEWALKSPRLIWAALRSDSIDLDESPYAPRFRNRNEFVLLDELILPEELKSRIPNLPSVLSSGEIDAVLLRGQDGSDRFELLGAVARAMGLSVLSQTFDDKTPKSEAWAQIGPLARITQSFPVVRFDLAPGQTLDLERIKGHGGGIGVVLGFEGGVRGPCVERCLTLTLPSTRFDVRVAHWRQHLAGHPVNDLHAIAERFHLPAGHIRRVAQTSLAHARLNGAESVSVEDVRQASRELGHQKLNTLAERIETNGNWTDLVVPLITESKLTELENRCRRREQLLERLGPAYDTGNTGVRALFTGSSGTGKTLASKLLAAVMGKDIYRVDLASIVNKYIGETEKNLHRVLSRAEELDVVLLLDEGDALLGNRTEVKSANDRYANLETNYLLQRLENYQGIVVITTNVGDHIDKAFQRRMDVVVDFVKPGPEERRRIWEMHLPAEHGISREFLEEVAQACSFSGGQIRNAAAGAALASLGAAAENNDSGSISDSDLKKAIRDECLKGGMVAPEFGVQHEEWSKVGMEGFLVSS
ncbi:MAG: ATP-binding protein [Verrucomicrobiota bacterium]